MLTERQKAIYDFILEFRRVQGCSPSIREIQEAFLIRSPNGVVGHLLALEAKGFIRRSKRGSRQIDVENLAVAPSSSLFSLPVAGRLPGAISTQGAREWVTLDEGALGFRPRPGCFVAKVADNAMTEAGILAGDMVVVEPSAASQTGQTLVARLGGESMLMRLSGDPPPELEIQGVVRALMRRLH